MKNKHLKVTIINPKISNESYIKNLLEKYQDIIKTYSFIHTELKQDVTEINMKYV